MKLNVKAFALTCGLLWGFSIFFTAWWIILFEGNTGEPTIIGMIYRGFSISPAGSIIGMVWGVVDGTVCGAIFALVYNFLSQKLSAK